MWTKVFLVAISALLFAQIIASGVQQESKQNTRENEYVDIEGHTYYIDVYNGHTHEGAKNVCQFLNMKMVTFTDRTKWLNVVDFLANRNYLNQHFWIGAMMDENSVWNWEDSGTPIEDFYWRSSQPDSNQNCMEFQPIFASAGWGDYDCGYWGDLMCE